MKQAVAIQSPVVPAPSEAEPRETEHGAVARGAFFAYGAIVYAFFFVSFLYTIGFLGNALVPVTIDAGGPTSSTGTSIAINTLLLGLFGIQHSVMARRGFKAWWTKIVPQPIERSTYVLASTLVLVLLMWQWRPMPEMLFQAESEGARAVLYGVYGLGWALVLYSTFLINHFDLFGLRQVFYYLRNRPVPTSRFVTPSLYKIIRHPLYLGWLLCFWVTPDLSVGRVLFAAITTAYIFVAVQFEEKDLVAEHGDEYRRYKESTPMIVPGLKKKA